MQHDEFMGTDVRTPTTMSFQDYLSQQEDQTISTGFEAAVHKQIDTGKSVDQQTGLLGDYNTISIPIPPSIVPTIFGRPSINLKVSGDVGIHAGVPRSGNVCDGGREFLWFEQGLDFKQEININTTTGTIGDKLKIGADWDRIACSNMTICSISNIRVTRMKFCRSSTREISRSTLRRNILRH